MIQAYDGDIGREQLLSEGATDDNGRYEITCTKDRLGGTSTHPDLIVQVCCRIMASTVREAGTEQVINLVMTALACQSIRDSSAPSQSQPAPRPWNR